MTAQLAGFAVALAASALYSLAIALQALEARQIPGEHSLRFSLLQRLARRPLWLAGALVGLLGWILQAAALLLAPLTLVEPTLAATLVFLLLFGARTLDERVGPREALGVLAVAAGVAGLGSLAPPHSARHAGGMALVLILLGLVAVVLAPSALGSRCRPSTLLVAAGAGIAYALVGLATKFAADDASSSAWRGLAAWLAVLATIAAVAVMNEMSALQLRPVMQVAPVVFALNVLVPVALAPVLAGEPWGGSSAVWGIIVSLGAVVAGVVALSRSGAVGAILDGDTPGSAPQGARESTAPTSLSAS